MRNKVTPLILFILALYMILGQLSAAAFTVKTSTIVFKGSASGRITIITSPIVFSGWEGGHISVTTSKIVYPKVSIPTGVTWAPGRPHKKESDTHLKPSPRISALKLNQPGPWYPGDNHSISWTSQQVSGKVRIFLIKGKTVASLLNANRFEWSLPGGVANNGYWRRNLPKNLPPDDHYRVLVESVDDPRIRGLSEFFPIRMKLNAAAFKARHKKHLAHAPGGAVVAIKGKKTFKPGKKPMAVMRRLTLTSPRGMETWYIGMTYPITWQSTGIEGRIRIVLEDRYGKRRTLNGILGTDVKQGRFDWKIGSNIKPGSMYKILVKTPDGKVKSRPSGGFNIKMKLVPGTMKKELKLKKRPASGTIIKVNQHGWINIFTATRQG